MSVPSQISVNASTGNGVTTVFPYSFKVQQASDLEVSVDGTVKTLTTDYTVSGVGVDGGGNVTFLAAPANLTTVVRRRNMPLARSTNYLLNGDLTASTLNDDQDAPVLMLQQIQEETTRSIHVPVGESVSVLPDAGTRAATVLGFDANGDVALYSPSSAVTAGANVSMGFPYVHAQSRTLDDFGLDYANLFTFFTDSQKSDVRNGTLLVDTRDRIVYAIAEEPGRRFFAPAGFYVMDGNADLGAALGTWIVGEGHKTRFYQYTANVDTFRLRPTTAGTTGDYGFSCGLRDIAIYHTPVAATATSGAAARVTQMDGWKLDNVYFVDAAEGITIEGGQGGVLSNPRSFTSAAGPALGSESSILHFKQAPYGAGLFQHMFTTVVSGVNLSALGLRNSCIRVASCDGLDIRGGYLNNSGGSNSLINLTSDRNSCYMSELTLDGIYLDGLGSTNLGIDMPAHGFTSLLYHLTLGKGVTVANCTTGIVGRNANLQAYRDSANVINCSGYGRDIQAGANTVIEIDGTSRNCGSGGSGGDVRLVGGSSLSLSLKGFNSTAATTVVANISGSWGRGSITDSVNNTNVADLANTATFTVPLKTLGNVSAYTGAADNSWSYDTINAPVFTGSAFFAQATPTTKAAAATFTAPEMLSGIVTYTGAAAALTLPTGTVMDAGISTGNIGTDKGFQLSIINTGSGTATVTAGTGFTIVGLATVAVGTSGRFGCRRTAANTWVAYRIA